MPSFTRPYRENIDSPDPEDVDAFLEFQPRIAAETTNTLQVIGKVPDRDKVREAWTSDSNGLVSLRLGCFLGSRMIGQLSFFPEHSPPHPWTSHIGKFGMFILQEFWGEGIGRKFLTVMEDHARKVGITKIEALVRTQNERGLKLYLGMGFEIEGTRKNSAIIDGRSHDEFYIAKLI